MSLGLRSLLTLTFAACLSSCGTVSTIAETTTAGFNKVAEVTTAPFRPGVPVVEARQDQWKELPLGHERALAYEAEQRRKRGFWIFGGAVDFDEPELPEIGTPADASLLPPKS